MQLNDNSEDSERVELLLRRIKRTARLKARHQAVVERAAAELRCLVHDGFELKISGAVLADASGMSLARVYQMRDEVTVTAVR